MIRVYFKDGELRFTLPKGNVDKANAFIHGIHHIFTFSGEAGEYMVPLESQWKNAVAVAKRYGASITQEVEDYYQYQIRLDQERAERKRIEEERKRAIEVGECKQSRGCGLCEHLEYATAHTEMVNGERVYVAGTHYCTYAMRDCRYKDDEIEYAFEIRKEMRNYVPTIGYNPPAFVAKPYPCAGCKYLEASNKAWEEINKEKEGNV